jgi:HK97 family phage prohead protease
MTIARAWATELRIADPGERIIEGIAVPYGQRTPIYEGGMLFEEQFAPGAFRDVIARRETRVPILLHHDARSLPVGKSLSLRESDAGLHITARISETAAGNDALTLMRDGVLDGMSIGFYVLDGGDVWNSDRSERTVTNAALRETSLVNFPAYDGARVLAVRAAQSERDIFDDVADETVEAMDEVLEQFLPRQIMRARVELLGKV